MAIDERLRPSIRTQLTELLGSEANAPIEQIMPVPWHDVATNDDLRLLRADIDVLRADIGRNMADQRTEMHRSIVTRTRSLVGHISVFGAIMLGAARLPSWIERPCSAMQHISEVVTSTDPVDDGLHLALDRS